MRLDNKVLTKSKFRVYILKFCIFNILILFLIFSNCINAKTGRPEGISLQKPVKILVVDGGGAYGILSAKILAELEKKANKPLNELFDFMVGTSSGAIQVALLSTPKKDSLEPVFSAQNISDFYLKFVPKALTTSLFRKITTIGGITAPILSSKPLESILFDKFGGLKLNESLTHLIIPTYDLNTASIYTFDSKSKISGKYSIVDILLASTAIPNIIPAHPITMKGKTHYLTDATVIANSPIGIAIGYATINYPNRRKFIVSIGTGDKWPSCNPKSQGEQGLLSLLPNWLGMIYEGKNHSVKNYMTLLMKNNDLNVIEFYRINPPHSRTIGGPTDSSKENIGKIVYAANSYIKTHQYYLQAIVDSLMK